jgi:hypothetical protein
VLVRRAAWGRAVLDYVTGASCGGIAPRACSGGFIEGELDEAQKLGCC